MAKAKKPAPRPPATSAANDPTQRAINSFLNSIPTAQPAQNASNTPQPIGVNPDTTYPPRKGPQYEGTVGQAVPFMTSLKQRDKALRKPLYFDGMQTGLGLQDFPQSIPDIARLQESLVQAGLLKAGSYAPGQWDTLSGKAFAEILADANINNGISWQEALAARLGAAAKGELLAKASRVRQPLVVKLTSPDQIAQVANNAGKTLHGTYLSPEQMAAFTQAYQQQEQQYQTSAYASTGFNPATGQQDPQQLDPNTGLPIEAQGAGGIVTKQPDITSASEAAIRNQNPNQFMANTFTDRLDEILNKFKSNASAGQVGPI